MTPRLSLIGFLAIPILLAACAKPHREDIPVKGHIFLKRDVSHLPACVYHEDCPSDMDGCVELTVRERRCFTSVKLGNEVGCTAGEIIILTGDPYSLDCLAKLE